MATTIEANKDAVRGFVEAFNEGRLDRLADDYTEYDLAYPGGKRTLEDFEEKMDRLSDVLPDLTLTIEEMIAEGEMVAVDLTASATHEGEFYGVAGTGEGLEWALTMFMHVEDGKIAEVRVLRDLLGIMKQLGLVSEE